jgi:hypothetical protein
MPRIRRYVAVPSVLGALALVFTMVLASPAAQAKPKPPKPEKTSGDLIVTEVEAISGIIIKGNLIVEDGGWATLDGVTVKGDLIVQAGGVAVLGGVNDKVELQKNVVVNPGGAFGGNPEITTIIRGSVDAFEAIGFRLYNAEVSGDVQVIGCGGLIDGADQVVDILNSTIKGSVTYAGNHGPLLFVGLPGYPNVIDGDLAFTDNYAISAVEPYGLGLIFVYDNDIGGTADISGNSARDIRIGNNLIKRDLLCAENDPLPVDVDTNTVGGTTVCDYQTP